MRVAVAIDRFLDQMELEADFTPRSSSSYRSVLSRICDDPPRGLGAEIRLTDLEGRQGTDRLRGHIGHNWGTRSTGRRANVISIHHTFWGWAENEGLIDDDPARRIRRPPRRKADVRRPAAAELELGYRAANLYERAPWTLMDEVGLRNSTVCELRWRDLDLTGGEVHVLVKGNHRIALPLGPIALDRLRNVYRQLQPEPGHFVFTVERRRFEGNRRPTVTRDPLRPGSSAALRAMVERVCRRAGIRRLGPHALRHGFAMGFLNASGRDVYTLRSLMGHSKLATTEEYLDRPRLDDLRAALERAAEHRTSVASQDDTEVSDPFDPRELSIGPGRSRTSGPDAATDDAGTPRADAGPDRPVTDEEGSHK